MQCPRCGTSNEDGDRFCSSCGTVLQAPSPDREPVSGRQRLSWIFGQTRRARIVTGATIVALVVAVVAFIAIGSDEEASIPRDAYTLKAESVCLASKRAIVALERQYASPAGKEPLSTLARELVPVVGSWRTQMGELEPPADRVELAAQMEAALIEAEAQIGGLARTAAGGDAAETVAKAKQADTASTAVEEAVTALGLTRCGKATIGLSPAAD